MNIRTIEPPKVRGEGLVGFRYLDGLREQRLTAYEAIKGRHYMRRRYDGAAAERQPVNLTQQQWRTLKPFLAMQAPLADITPLRSDLEFEAQVIKTIADDQADEMRLDEVYEDATTEMMCSGFALTLNGIKSGGERFASRNRRLDMGREFTRVLDLDDVTLDPLAKTFDELRFIGHRYATSREEAIDAIADGTFGCRPEDYEDGLLPNPYCCTPEEAQSVLENIPYLETWGRVSERADDNESERFISGLRLDETVLLWDFVFYVHGEIWIGTLPGQPGSADPFRVGDPDKFLAFYRWRGPGNGPINRITPLRVPFNKVPVAIEAMQRDLSDIADLTSNKIVRQLLRAKNLVVYEGSQEDMAMAMRKSPEGGYIRGNPKSVTQIPDGGILPGMLQGSQYFSDHWQQATGNLAMAAGTGDIGKTATAFEGLMGRIQGYLDFLRSKIEQLATDDLRIRVWFLTNNPAMTRTVQQTIGQAPYQMNVGATIAAPGAPMAQSADYVLQGTHQDFDLRVRAFSMTYQNPITSAKMLMDLMTNALPAIMTLAQSGAVNPREAISILARKLNEPALENIVPDPLIAQLQQQWSQMMPQLVADPSGQGLGGQQQMQAQFGPAGRRLPAQGRLAQRAFNPGPGTGAPRPMNQPQGQRPPGAAMTAGAAA